MLLFDIYDTTINHQAINALRQQKGAYLSSVLKDESLCSVLPPLFINSSHCLSYEVQIYSGYDNVYQSVTAYLGTFLFGVLLRNVFISASGLRLSPAGCSLLLFTDTTCFLHCFVKYIIMGLIIIYHFIKCKHF